MQEQGNVLWPFNATVLLASDLTSQLPMAPSSCLLVSGEVQRAICALRRAVQLEPNFPMLTIILAMHFGLQ